MKTVMSSRVSEKCFWNPDEFPEFLKKFRISEKQSSWKKKKKKLKRKSLKGFLKGSNSENVLLIAVQFTF